MSGPGWLQVGLASDPGQARRDNQDSLFALATPLPPQGAGGRPLPFGFFAVADGMGGLSAGGEASNLALRIVTYRVVDRMLTPALAGPGGDGPQFTVAESLRTAIEEASAAIYSMAGSAGRRM